MNIQYFQLFLSQNIKITQVSVEKMALFSMYIRIYCDLR